MLLLIHTNENVRLMYKMLKWNWIEKAGYSRECYVMQPVHSNMSDLYINIYWWHKYNNNSNFRWMNIWTERIVTTHRVPYASSKNKMKTLASTAVDADGVDGAYTFNWCFAELALLKLLSEMLNAWKYQVLLALICLTSVAVTNEENRKLKLLSCAREKIKNK